MKSIFLALGWEGLPLTSPNLKRMGRYGVSAKFQAVEFSPGSSLIRTPLVVSYGDLHERVTIHGHMQRAHQEGLLHVWLDPCGMEAVTVVSALGQI